MPGRLQNVLLRRQWARALMLLPMVAALGGTAHADVPGASIEDGHEAAVQLGFSDEYAAMIADAARRVSLPASWIAAVLRAESGGNPRAVSPVGAMGLMQVMPGTWRAMAARYDLGADPFEPRANIQAGAAYLRLMWERYGDLETMLAAYNAGPGRTDAFLAGRRTLPGETTEYVARVMGMIGNNQTVAVAVPASFKPASWRDARIFPVRTQVATEGAARASASANVGPGVPESRAALAAPASMPDALFVSLYGNTFP